MIQTHGFRFRELLRPGCLPDPYSDRLLALVHEENWELAIKLIRKGEGLRWSSFGWTVLHFAIWKSAPEPVVLAMLKSGLSANECVAEDGKSALHYAVQYNPLCLPVLLQHHGDANFPDNNGETPLALAAAKGNSEVLRVLLDAGGNPNRATNDKVTPLMQAVTASSAECVRLLLDRGADRNACDDQGRSALQLAHMLEPPSEVILTLIDYRLQIRILLCATQLQSRKHNEKSSISMLSLDLIRTLCSMLA